VLRFRLMVKRGPHVRPQASEGEARSALLEAVFDDIAVRGGLHRIPGIMAGSDPQPGLLAVISIFCDFWSFGSDALGPLHAAGAIPNSGRVCTSATSVAGACCPFSFVAWPQIVSYPRECWTT